MLLSVAAAPGCCQYGQPTADVTETRRSLAEDAKDEQQTLFLAQHPPTDRSAVAFLDSTQFGFVSRPNLISK